MQLFTPIVMAMCAFLALFGGASAEPEPHGGRGYGIGSGFSRGIGGGYGGGRRYSGGYSGGLGHSGGLGGFGGRRGNFGGGYRRSSYGYSGRSYNKW